jgi:hypothetical protein
MLGMDTGWPACTGVQFRWLRPWPQAKILLPEHHLWPCLRLLGLYSFFLHAHCKPPHHFPKRWIAFRLPPVVNTFGHLSAISATFSVFTAVFSSWRLQNCAICHGLVAATRYLDVHFPYRTAGSSFSISDLISSPLPIVVARYFFTLPVPSPSFLPLPSPSGTFRSRSLYVLLLSSSFCTLPPCSG